MANRIPKAKPGELLVKWGIPERKDRPDVVFSWGAGTSKRDANLLMNVFGGERFGPSIIQTETEPSLLDELKARGYDITTIRFSIKKIGTTTNAGKKK